MFDLTARSFYPAFFDSSDANTYWRSFEFGASMRLAFSVLNQDPDLSQKWEKVNFGPIVHNEDGTTRRVVVGSYSTGDKDSQRNEGLEKVFFFLRDAGEEGSWRLVGHTSLRPYDYATKVPPAVIWLD